MAEPAKKKRRIVKPAETVREKAAKKAEPKKPRRVRSVVSTAAKPVSKAKRFGKREYHLPLPDNKAGKFLGKRVRFMPKFLVNSWNELRQVNWPTNRETLKLSMAVFIFALIFGGLIYAVDYGLERLFREVLIG